MTYPSMILEEQMQNERLARARMALERGEMTVQPVYENTWIIVSKRSQYTVTLDGDAWTCTCPDFADRCQRFGLRCKHIEAVRFIETQRISAARNMVLPNTKNVLSVQHTEEVMSQTSPVDLEMAGQRNPIVQIGVGDPLPDEVIQRLRQPLDMNRVKRRQASGQGTVPYLEGYDVIEVANDLFLFRWSFDLLSDPKVMRWDKVVTFFDQHSRRKVPVLGEDGKPTSEVAGIVYLTGKVTVELGEKAYSHADVGRCIFSGDTPEALDMAIAGAATDCLKRCFRQLGEQFGNSLYDKEIARTAGLENGNSAESLPRGFPQGSQPSNPSSHNNQSSISQVAVAQSEAMQYQDGTEVEASNAAEVAAFNTFKAHHRGLAPATREILRAWMTTTNDKK